MANYNKSDYNKTERDVKETTATKKEAGAQPESSKTERHEETVSRAPKSASVKSEEEQE